MNKELEEKVLNTFARIFNVDVKNLTVNDTKDDIESWDSIGHLQLIMSLESEFAIKFKTKQISEINDIKSCINIVEKSTSSK